MTDVARSSCFCGKVHVEVSGDPVLQGYCHCDDCRHWSGTPVTAYAMWPQDNVRIVSGEDHLGSFTKNGVTIRRSCSECGGSVMTESQGMKLIDVYPTNLEGFDFAPTTHIRYGQRVIDMPDGLPKFKDLPEKAGGSGEMIPD